MPNANNIKVGDMLWWYENTELYETMEPTACVVTKVFDGLRFSVTCFHINGAVAHYHKLQLLTNPEGNPMPETPERFLVMRSAGGSRATPLPAEDEGEQSDIIDDAS